MHHHLDSPSFYQTFWDKYQLSGYQKTILDSMMNGEVDTVIVPRARVCGTTMALAAGMIYKALIHERQTIVFVDQHEGIRTNLLALINDMMLNGNALHKKYGIQRLVRSTTRDRVELLNGSRIVVTPPSERAGRGLSLNMLVYGSIPQAKEQEINHSLMPCLMTNDAKFVRVCEMTPTNRTLKVHASKPIDLVMSDEQDSFIRRF